MLRTIIVLAVTQVIGWGCVGLTAIVGREIGDALGMSLPAVFLGNSVFYVVMGLAAPLLAGAFARHGARLVMMAGSLLAAPGFALLALAQGPVAYFLAWVVIGAAGAATLTTPAHILLNEIGGQRARSAIGTLMLATGLSASLFWPATALLSAAAGWRGVCLAFALILLLVCLPLHAFALPRTRPAGTVRVAAGGAGDAKGPFGLVVAAIALNAFVTFGLSALLIELLKAQGLAPTQAVLFGSLLGVVQVSARGLDLIGGGRWDGLTTGLVAAVVLPAGLLLLAVGQGAAWSVAGFILLYGAGSGAFAVARATIPLVFYDQAAYARAASRIALPLNLLSAIAPPLLATLLTQGGSRAVLGVALLCSGAVLPILLALRRRRPGAAK